MPRQTTGIAGAFPTFFLLGWILLFAYIAVYAKFSSPEIDAFIRLYFVSFVLMPGFLTYVKWPETPKKILFDDSLTPSDTAGDFFLGALSGAVLFVSFMAPWGFRALTAAMGIAYAPMASGSQYSQFLISVAEPVPQILTALVVNIVLVAFGEEFTMGIVRQRLNLALANPLQVYGITAIIFASLHFFAYSGLAPGAYVGAAFGSLLFTFLFFWRGFYAGVMAHGTYNWLAFLTQKTGTGDIISAFPFPSIIVTVAMFVVILWYMRKEKKV